MKAIFPILLASSLFVLRTGITAETNHDFKRWEVEISAFDQQDRTNPPPKGGLLFIGSSTIRGWKTLAQDFPDRAVLNRGFGGSQIVDATHFADRLIFPFEPKAVLLRAGGNDINAGKMAAEVFADYQAFVSKIHSRLPDATIVFISLSPSIARWKQHDAEKEVNRLIQEFSQGKPKLGYIETYDLPLDKEGNPRPEVFVADKLHFNSEGYKLLAARVRPNLPK